MPEIMEPKVLQPGVLQDALVECGHRVWVVHGAGPGGREQPGVAWVLGVLLHEQIHRLLGDGDLPDGVLCLWPCHDQLVVLVLRGLLADGDGFV